jgi:hypothetical protein
MSRLGLLGALMLLVSVACNKKETPAEPAPEAAPATAVAAAAAPAAAEPVVDLDSVPVEEQYEAEAEKEITVDNLTAKLDELEKELAAP